RRSALARRRADPAAWGPGSLPGRACRSAQGHEPERVAREDVVVLAHAGAGHLRLPGQRHNRRLGWRRERPRLRAWHRRALGARRGGLGQGPLISFRATPPPLSAWNLSALTDLAFGTDGSLYLLRRGSPIPACCSHSQARARSGSCRRAAGGHLRSSPTARATGLVVGVDGALYVSVNGASAG